jgi:hypothetical protein
MTSFEIKRILVQGLQPCAYGYKHPMDESLINSIVAFSLTRQLSSKLLALAHHNRQVRGFGLYTLKTINNAPFSRGYKDFLLVIRIHKRIQSLINFGKM